MVRVSNFQIFSNFGLTKNLKSFFICPVSSDILTLEKKCFWTPNTYESEFPKKLRNYEVSRRMVRDFLKNLRNFFICPVSSHILTLEKNCFFIKAHFLSLPGISDNEVYDWPYHKPSKIKPQMAKLRLELSISLARRVSAHISNSSA